MLLAGNCILYAGPFFDISSLFAAEIVRFSEEDYQSRANVGSEALTSSPIPPTKETGTGPVIKTALFFEVGCPDAMTVLPP